MINESRNLCGICRYYQAKPYLCVYYPPTNVKIICCSKNCLDFFLIGMSPIRNKKKVTFQIEEAKSNTFSPQSKRLSDVERVKKLILFAQEDDL